MKYYSYNEYSYNVHGDVDPCVAILSEEEIIKEYWDYWQKRMIAKFGKEHFEANYSEKDCIDDWVVVNWAWETNKREKMKTNEIIKALRDTIAGHRDTDGIPELILAASRLQELEASTLHIIRQAAEAQDERDEYIKQCDALNDKLEIALNNSAKLQSKYDEAAANVQRLKKALDESEEEFIKNYERVGWVENISQDLNI